MFDLIPALDVSGGRLARLTQGGVELVAEFKGDALAAAEFFASAGATWLHVVDLDLALTGRAANLELLRAIAGLGVSVQSSGGVRTARSVDEALDAGAERVVLSSAALGDRVLFEILVASGGPRVAVGLEVDADRIRSRGVDPVDLPLDETLAWLGRLSLARVIVTAVSRVGGFDGPDLEAVASAAALGRPVVVAGGVSSVEHIESVRNSGAEAVVIGRALLEGRLDLRAALMNEERG
jgi:phosphoribosylformimino-5-aminoimidazole carboxamide ribonucleotide (ProFAR) isomerase